jgi:hypothetical protein
MEAPMERRFDRTPEDLDNIVALEHVDHQQATVFYVAGLGLTRDLGKAVAARMITVENSVRVVDLVLRAVGGSSYIKRGSKGCSVTFAPASTILLTATRGRNFSARAHLEFHPSTASTRSDASTRGIGTHRLRIRRFNRPVHFNQEIQSPSHVLSKDRLERYWIRQERVQA